MTPVLWRPEIGERIRYRIEVMLRIPTKFSLAGGNCFANSWRDLDSRGSANFRHQLSGEMGLRPIVSATVTEIPFEVWSLITFSGPLRHWHPLAWLLFTDWFLRSTPNWEHVSSVSSVSLYYCLQSGIPIPFHSVWRVFLSLLGAGSRETSTRAWLNHSSVLCLSPHQC